MRLVGVLRCTWDCPNSPRVRLLAGASTEPQSRPGAGYRGPSISCNVSRRWILFYKPRLSPLLSLMLLRTGTSVHRLTWSTRKVGGGTVHSGLATVCRAMRAHRANKARGTLGLVGVVLASPGLTLHLAGLPCLDPGRMQPRQCSQPCGWDGGGAWSIGVRRPVQAFAGLVTAALEQPAEQRTGAPRDAAYAPRDARCGGGTRTLGPRLLAALPGPTCWCEAGVNCQVSLTLEPQQGYRAGRAGADRGRGRASGSIYMAGPRKGCSGRRRRAPGSVCPARVPDCAGHAWAAVAPMHGSIWEREDARREPALTCPPAHLLPTAPWPTHLATQPPLPWAVRQQAWPLGKQPAWLHRIELALQEQAAEATEALRGRGAGGEKAAGTLF